MGFHRIVGQVTLCVLIFTLVATMGGCGNSGAGNLQNDEDPHWIYQAPNRNKVAVVFVHGIFGTTTGTWTNDTGQTFFDFLRNAPDIGGKADIFAFGFTSSMFKGGSLNILSAATKLDEWLSYSHIWENYQTVVFVAHSMGGLVVMQELLDHPERRLQVPVAVLYATPQEGSLLAALGSKALNNPALAEMVPANSSQYLDGLDHSWSLTPSNQRTALICAYETKSVDGLPVVDRFSSTRFCEGARFAIGGADHISIVKPERQTSDSVIVLVNALEKYVFVNDGRPLVEAEELQRDGDRFVYLLHGRWRNNVVHLRNKGSQRVPYKVSDITGDKLLITPTDYPQYIDGGATAELQLYLLSSGKWANSYEFTLSTPSWGDRRILVKIDDLAAAQTNVQFRTSLLEHSVAPSWGENQPTELSYQLAVASLHKFQAAKLDMLEPHGNVGQAESLLVADALSNKFPSVAHIAYSHAIDATPMATPAPPVQNFDATPSPRDQPPPMKDH